VNRGWIRLWRKSLDKGWLRSHKLWALWTWALIKASHKDHVQIVGGQEVHLKPGQFVFGRRMAAEELGMSEREIRTRVAFLIKAGNLTIKATNKFSIISIVNWGTYQPEPVSNDQQNDQQATSKRPQTRRERMVIYSGEHFSVTQKQHEKYLKAYPDLDLQAEYMKMDAWLESNPKKRKTPGGYPRFVNNWLSKAFKEKESGSTWKDDLPDL